MRYVTMVETFDGMRHADAANAKRHLENVYGLQLSKIAHGLAKTDGKYVAMQDYIDANLEQFTHLAAIKADMEREDD